MCRHSYLNAAKKAFIASQKVDLVIVDNIAPNELNTNFRKDHDGDKDGPSGGNSKPSTGTSSLTKNDGVLGQ